MVLIFPATSGKVQMAHCYKREATNSLFFSLKIHQVFQIIKGNTYRYPAYQHQLMDFTVRVKLQGREDFPANSPQGWSSQRLRCPGPAERFGRLRPPFLRKSVSQCSMTVSHVTSILK